MTCWRVHFQINQGVPDTWFNGKTVHDYRKRAQEFFEAGNAARRKVKTKTGS